MGDQNRGTVPWRAYGEVQSAAAHRRGAGRLRRFPRGGLPHARLDGLSSGNNMLGLRVRCRSIEAKTGGGETRGAESGERERERRTGKGKRDCWAGPNNSRSI